MMTTDCRCPITPGRPARDKHHSSWCEIGRKQEIAARPPHLNFDGPPCPDCGSICIRTGSCHTCLNCGETTGCG